MLNNRIFLDHASTAAGKPVLEMAMLGHCPGKINLNALSSKMRLLMRSNGYDAHIDCLENAAAEQDSVHHNSCTGINRESLAKLFHLPIPITSVGEFAALFPESESESTVYQSKIAGNYAWLPLAVKDFFTSGGELLWLVRIPESERQQGFLPVIKTGLHDSRGLKGLATLFPIRSVGLVAFPDLERLQLKSYITTAARKNLKNPQPVFLPCSTDQTDDHRERRTSDEIITHPEPISLYELISPIMHHLESYRPDLMCLYSPALEYDAEHYQPMLCRNDIAAINKLKSSYPEASYLRRIQFLHPYIQSAEHPLKSATGSIGGLQCANAKKNGIWRSIAGLPLTIKGLPYPEIASSQISLYRQKYGLSVVYDQGQYITLDDEQLTVSAFQSARSQKVINKHRAAEIPRFIGFLLRELKLLGDSLIFISDSHDPAPRLLLEGYFKNLYQSGALRGSNEEEAYAITDNSSDRAINSNNENSIQYDIQIRPAYPIDSIKLIFNRINNSWQVNTHG